ncbi:hypothetical protein PFBG_05079 [Plasmodium falciparum 7G8]|uniref:Uncharacterized protein n=2 Tax=Plasmodium falciparum TaxID=5833 RepID=A0A024W2E8_PLAFA|nr:hypothetical protein PFTANZ_05011 [Plasmodium falciparum Tanzania (2000708)]EUR64841.1 hypothetical protein PFBG_05079 [Plasmodium falciparum 7G8]
MDHLFFNIINVLYYVNEIIINLVIILFIYLFYFIFFTNKKNLYGFKKNNVIYYIVKREYYIELKNRSNIYIMNSNI